MREIGVEREDGVVAVVHGEAQSSDHRRTVPALILATDYLHACVAAGDFLYRGRGAIRRVVVAHQDGRFRYLIQDLRHQTPNVVHFVVRHDEHERLHGRCRGTSSCLPDKRPCQRGRTRYDLALFCPRNHRKGRISSASAAPAVSPVSGGPLRTASKGRLCCSESCVTALSWPGPTA